MMVSALSPVLWSLRVWRQAHAACGKGRGPWVDARMHTWQVHRCSCGSRFYVPEAEICKGDDATGETR